MNTNDIYNLLALDRETAGSFTLGVIPFDALIYVSPLSTSHAYIVNSLNRYSPRRRGHWLVFVLTPGGRRLDIFDPLGCRSVYRICKKLPRKFIERFDKIIVNYESYQSSKTDTCGLYCLLYLYYVSRGVSRKNTLLKVKETDNIEKAINRLYTK